MLLTDTGSGDFETIDGTHTAVCYRVIDLGTQESSWEGKTSFKHQVFLQWEITDERMSDDRPFVVGSFYTASLAQTAKLRQHLEAWRGKEFTDEELAGFDPVNLLGQPCTLIISKNAKGKMNVSSVGKAMKGITIPPLVNEKIYLSLTPGQFNDGLFDKLSDGIKRIIMASPEYAARYGEKTPPPAPIKPVPSGIPLSHIPDEVPDDMDSIPF